MFCAIEGLVSLPKLPIQCCEQEAICSQMENADALVAEPSKQRPEITGCRKKVPGLFPLAQGHRVCHDHCHLWLPGTGEGLHQIPPHQQLF